MARGIYASGRGMVERVLRRSVYKVERAIAEGGHLRVGNGTLVTGPMVWIEDMNGPVSVTNDAERVCVEVNLRYPGYRIIYRDSEGHWDELVHKNGDFQGYLPARHLEP